ncbi:MAG TPA: hypothetical protein VIO56_03945 [Methylotenera sp.]
MKMSKRAVTILAASAVFVSQVVVAATVATPVKLTQVQGDVMVNNGSRFVKAVSGTELKPGAKIVTAKSSNVSLVYQNGCVKQLKQNTMHTVGTAEQCAANIGKERTYVAALGDTSLVIPANNVIINPVIIGFVGALGTVVATQSNNDNNNNNISAE